MEIFYLVERRDDDDGRRTEGGGEEEEEWFNYDIITNTLETYFTTIQGNVYF